MTDAAVLVLPALVSDDLRYLAELASGDGDGPNFTDAPTAHPAVQEVIAAMTAVNEEMWRFPLDRWWPHIVSYRPGACFPMHRDYDPGRGPRREAITFAASVLLNDPAEFTGGDLVVSRENAPREKGAAVIFHGFTEHQVTPVLSGTRVALVVFAVYGTNDEAHARGWPDDWTHLR